MPYDEQLHYTTILHSVRKRFGLSMNDYVIADAIYHLSNNPASPKPGWCFASRNTLANLFGLSRGTIHNSLKKLEKKGLIIFSDERHIRTTQLWYEHFVIARKQILKEGVE